MLQLLTLSFIVLDIRWGSCTENNSIILYSRHGGPNQKWIVDFEGRIISVHCRGKALGSTKSSDPNSIGRLQLQSVSQDLSMIQKWNVSYIFQSIFYKQFWIATNFFTCVVPFGIPH